MKREFNRKNTHERCLGVMYYKHNTKKLEKPDPHAQGTEYREIRVDLWIWHAILRWDA